MNSSHLGRSSGKGFSLIEVLLVLTIIGVLLATISTFSRKAPKAVRTGLQDVKASLIQARGVAMAAGKFINVHLVPSGTTTRMTAAELNDDGTEKTALLMSASVGQNWGTYANLTTSDPPIADEGTPVKDLASLATLGFSGWATPILPDGAASRILGFAPDGTPQFVNPTTKVRSAIPGGTWVGIAGSSINKKGLPYGCVFLLQNGLVVAYYKPDNLLDDAANKWQRLE